MCVAFPMLAGGKREREGKEKGRIHSPLAPARGLLNVIPYAGWWRVREKEGEMDSCPWERKKWELPRFSKHPSWTIWKPQHRSLWPVSITHLWSKWVAGSPDFESTVPLRTSLIHPSMRVLWWDVDPECWPNY
jgi:hypothetical protein